MISEGEKLEIGIDAKKTTQIKQNSIVLTGNKPGEYQQKLNITMVRNIPLLITWLFLLQKKY